MAKIRKFFNIEKYFLPFETLFQIKVLVFYSEIKIST